MVNGLLGNMKKQRMTWSWALIVGLFLVLVAHAPVLPVIAGCALAIGLATLRSSASSRGPGLRTAATRGGQRSS
jgi:hypothetical protein